MRLSKMAIQFISTFRSGSSLFFNFAVLVFCLRYFFHFFSGSRSRCSICILLSVTLCPANSWEKAEQVRILKRRGVKWIIFILLEGSALHTVREQQLTTSLFFSWYRNTHASLCSSVDDIIPAKAISTSLKQQMSGLQFTMCEVYW